MTYTIFANGVRACPKCAAAMRIMPDGSYKCHDCRSVFDIVGMGTADNELEIKERFRDAQLLGLATGGIVGYSKESSTVEHGYRKIALTGGDVVEK